MYFDSPSDLNDDLVEEAIQIGLLAGESSDIDQNANVAPNLVKYATFVRGGEFLHRLLMRCPGWVLRGGLWYRLRRARLVPSSSCSAPTNANGFPGKIGVLVSSEEGALA
jgi:hypothetical protein